MSSADTRLHEAIEQLDFTKLKRAIAGGARLGPDNKNDYGLSPIRAVAARLDAPEKDIKLFIDTLIEAGCPIDPQGDPTLLALACTAQSHQYLVRRALKAGHNPNLGVKIRDMSGNMTTQRPLHNAVKAQRHHVVEMLLWAGADVDARDEAGCNALHACIYAGCSFDSEMLEILMDHGLDLDNWTSPKDPEESENALWMTAKIGYETGLDLLLKAGANPCARLPVAPEDANITPLAHAILWANPLAVKMFRHLPELSLPEKTRICQNVFRNGDKAIIQAATDAIPEIFHVRTPLTFNGLQCEDPSVLSVWVDNEDSLRFLLENKSLRTNVEVDDHELLAEAVKRKNPWCTLALLDHLKVEVDAEFGGKSIAQTFLENAFPNNVKEQFCLRLQRRQTQITAQVVDDAFAHHIEQPERQPRKSKGISL